MNRAALYPWIGLVGGVVFSLCDLALLRLFGVEMQIDGRDMTWWVWAVFATTSGGLGAALGLVARARRRARADAETIREQLAALRAARAEVARMEQLAGLGRMAAGMAHEVRNPLAVIRSSAGLIGEDLPEGGEGALASRFIQEEVDRLDRFVGKVLDLARPVPLERSALDLADVVRRAALSSGQTIPLVGPLVGPLEGDLGGPEPALEGDPELVTRLVAGLVGNARQAGAERVIARLGRSPGGRWLEIADDGPGVPEADRERLFEPFFTTRASGTGLGLAVAARIAEAHGGLLVYRHGGGAGPEGAGACFRLSIPAAAFAASQEIP